MNTFSLSNLFTFTKLLSVSIRKMIIKSKIDKPSIFDRIKKVDISKRKLKNKMSLLWSKNGFRGEYLAKFIVSRFAFISESNVSEDYGIDFYCGLIKAALNKDYVHYDKPFLLQIKTKTKQESEKNDIVYDTIEKIETLYNLNLPFFIGYLDNENQKLEIFSTSSMWHAFLIKGYLNVHKIVFKFRKNNSIDNILTPTYKQMTLGEHKCGGHKYIVDLGHPLISIDINELDKNENKIENIRIILSKCIDKEFDNITNKKLELYYYRWVHKYETNNPNIEFGYNFLEKDDGVTDFDQQRAIDNLHHYLISLAIVFNENNDNENYKKVCGLTKLISKTNRLENITNKFPEIYGLKKQSNKKQNNCL